MTCGAGFNKTNFIGGEVGNYYGEPIYARSGYSDVQGRPVVKVQHEDFLWKTIPEDDINYQAAYKHENHTTRNLKYYHQHCTARTKLWSDADGSEALNDHYWTLKNELGTLEITTGFAIWPGLHGDGEGPILVY